MICFTLRCGNDHSFDNWFTSSQAFDSLVIARHVSCPVCGDIQIAKALMAPAISSAEPQVRDDTKISQTAPTTPTPLRTPQNDVERAMAAMRRVVEANSDYVGLNFADEARKIHSGEARVRAIYGEARSDEARALMEDGIAVTPLPFMPRAKVN